MEFSIYPLADCEEFDSKDPLRSLSWLKIDETCNTIDGGHSKASQRNKFRRKIIFLKSGLCGHWKKIHDLSYCLVMEDINIIDKGDVLEVISTSDIPLPLARKISEKWDSNLNSLESLCDELMNRDYIKIDEENDFWSDLWGLLNYPKSHPRVKAQINKFGMRDGFWWCEETAKDLGIKLTGIESNKDISYLMWKELERRGKMLYRS